MHFLVTLSFVTEFWDLNIANDIPFPHCQSLITQADTILRILFALLMWAVILCRWDEGWNPCLQAGWRGRAISAFLNLCVYGGGSWKDVGSFTSGAVVHIFLPSSCFPETAPTPFLAWSCSLRDYEDTENWICMTFLYIYNDAIALKSFLHRNGYGILLIF